MARFASLFCALFLLALVTLSVPCQAQFNFPKIDPGDILNKVLNKNKPKGNTSVPANRTASPANDNFADREPLVGAEVRANATIRGATAEADEPMHLPNERNARTVWWTWTAPATGSVMIDTLGGVSNTRAIALAVYTGSELSSLKPVMRGSADADSTLGFSAKSGVAYQIVANGYTGCIGQTGFNLHFHPLHPKPQVKP